MARSAANNATQSDDAVGFFFFEEGFGNDRNFESAGNADEIDARRTGVELDFLDSIFDESVGKFGVEFRSYDCDPDFAPGNGAGFWWNDGRHAGLGMSWREGFVN